VVSYVNTSAAVKAETDICCTSSNAVEVVESIPTDREILFLPDQFLGAHVQRVTGRTNMRIWMGECHVHAGISPTDLRASVEANPDAELLVHPECGCATSALWMVGQGDLPQERVHVLSTGGMLDQARRTTAKRVLVATEIGMLHQLRQANRTTVFEPVNSRAACPYMKMSTPEKLLRRRRRSRSDHRAAGRGPGAAPPPGRLEPDDRRGRGRQRRRRADDRARPRRGRPPGRAGDQGRAGRGQHRLGAGRAGRGAR
jgi:quinolinate synthase